MSRLTAIITASDPEIRNRSLDAFCAGARAGRSCWPSATALDRFRRASDNLYERVRALFFLYAIHRFHIPRHAGREDARALHSVCRLRQSAEAALRGSDRHVPRGAGGATGRARRFPARWPRPIARSAFQTLADQVRRSVRSVRGNQWMFRTGHPADYPLRIRPELLARGRRWPFPDSARGDAGAHGPDPQRLERHLLPRHGLSRKARGCSTSRSISACAAPERQPRAAGGSVFPRHRRAGAAAGQRRSEGAPPRSPPSPRSSTSRAITWGC